MNFWTAVVIIVAMTVIGGMYRERIRAGGGNPGEPLEELLRRLERMEERIANLETIVLEKERARAFSDLEGGGSRSS